MLDIRIKFTLRLNIPEWGKYVKGDTMEQIINVLNENTGLVRFPIDKHWDIINSEQVKVLPSIGKAMEELKPSDFYEYPVQSMANHLYENILARNIMKVLMIHGDEFAKLTYLGYQKTAKELGCYTAEDYIYFSKVSRHCISAEAALDFCPYWIKSVK